MPRSLRLFPLDAGTSSGGDAGAAESLETRLQKAEQESQAGKTATATMNRLMADPEIRAVLMAKQAGEQVSVIKRAELEALKAARPDPADTGGDDDAGDPTGGSLSSLDEEQRALAQTILGATNKSVEAAIKKHLDPLRQSLGEITQRSQSQEVASKKQQIDAARTKYRDFDKVLPDLINLANEFPTMNPDELYVFYKHRTGGAVERITSFESEKGTTGASKIPNISSGRKTPLPPGRQGFAAALEEAQNALETRERTVR